MLDLMRKRRSIRKYQDRPLSDDLIQILEEVLLRAPSGKNLKSWEYIFVNDKKILEKMAIARSGNSSAFINGAQLGIVFLGNREKADTWIEDASLAAIIAQLTATSLGLGSCWAQVRNRAHSPEKTSEDYLKELLGVPETFGIVCVVAIGYPDEVKLPLNSDLLPYEKIHRNRF